MPRANTPTKKLCEVIGGNEVLKAPSIETFGWLKALLAEHRDWPDNTELHRENGHLTLVRKG